jgi:predicted nuclease of predicted toxin-antitoxin system
MKLLIDANLAPGLAHQLADLFPGSIHVETLGLAASDTEIWEYAKSHGFTIVSKDSDFEQRALVFGSPPKVIWVRLGNCRKGVVESLLRQRFEDITSFESDPHECILALP